MIWYSSPVYRDFWKILLWKVNPLFLNIISEFLNVENKIMIKGKVILNDKLMFNNVPYSNLWVLWEFVCSFEY